MSFKMLTVASSFSLGVASWKAKLIYIERIVPKRPDYLDFRCRGSIEREEGRRTKTRMVSVVSSHTFS